MCLCDFSDKVPVSEEVSAMNSKFRSTVLPLLAAFIWGTAFVAQKVSTARALTFNASRSIVAVVFLLLLILILTKGDVRHLLSEKNPSDTKKLWVGGILCGAALAAATFFQQYGMDHGTEAGKAGFITALYIMLVPILGLFLKKKAGWNVWLAVGLAVVGLYFLCIGENLTVRSSDMCVLVCAFLFAVQIHLIDHYSVYCNCVKLSCIQFLTSFVLSAIGALLFETVTVPILRDNLIPILYLGVFSSGIAYTLQMIAQKGANPAVVSVLMSMESVFSVLSSAVILREKLTGREYLGCGIMFMAVLLTELNLQKKKG